MLRNPSSKRQRGALFGGLLFFVGCSILGCSKNSSNVDSDAEFPGGETTNKFLLGPNAFKEHVANIRPEHESEFFSGNSFFNSAWVEAPSSTTGRDGLGPMFNARNCSACHLNDGRGRPPLEVDEGLIGLLFRLGTGSLGVNGEPLGDPNYGDQFQPYSLPKVPVEAAIAISIEKRLGKYGDGEAYELLAPTYGLKDGAYGPFVTDVRLSPRVAPAMIGLGLLEAIREADVLVHADVRDEDGDGISGKPNRVWDVSEKKTVLGRFGWKAEQPTVRQQAAGAFFGDMGLTSSLFSDVPCSPVQLECLAEPNGGEPEVSDETLRKVEVYSRLLAVPVRPRFDDPETLAGEALFHEAGCAGCHVPSFTTGKSDLEELENQRIFPYTDLLLHDMGEALSDNRPSFEAEGSEWRTPPLWGLGRIEDVNRHDRLLHDGRARGVAEAILWHGGEGEAAKKVFSDLGAKDRELLVRFVESL